ncbi:MFS transporter [uncultured Megasphaera sp.]|uniref:MFS transporter n=1 Tax=uncultured Megasphaera sp. TaxID=165188 RepID=UPI0026591A6C|nr:MFS transporter [uncultured Megasphaera sp.]
MTATFQRQLRLRWMYLGTAVILLLCLGLIYAWSIFRIPLEREFGWSSTETSVTFSISMMMFCFGGVASGILTAHRGVRTTLIACAVCLASGFGLASQASSLWEIYVTYGGLCGFGVGLGYNGAISTAVKWFPDRTGLVSGISLMGFGLGAMILGMAAAACIELVGWRTTFLCIAVAFGFVVLAGAFILKAAPAAFLQHMSGHMAAAKQSVEDLQPTAMICRRNFWLYFAWAAVLSAAGLAIINISAGYAGEFSGGNLAEAAALAGVVSIANGVGRILFGQCFDSQGYRRTMAFVTILVLAAGLAFIAADMTRQTPVLLLAFVLIGLSYGGVTPTNSAFTAFFFGRTHYALNFSVTNLNLIIASYAGPLCASGKPLTAFVIMIGLAVVAGVLLFCIRRPRQQVS